jgi:hypothetical protein
MPEEPLHQPHDKLFKSAFGDPATTAGFLRWEIPADLSAAIDWERLRLEPGSFVDSHFRQSESDLLFSAPVGTSRCLIHLLFEHQLAPDPWIALRLLRYQLRIWETWRRNHPDRARLPVILPVVLAQNAEVWHISPRFSSLLDIPDPFAKELDGMVPDFTFRLIQLAETPFDAIRGTPGRHPHPARDEGRAARKTAGRHRLGRTAVPARPARNHRNALPLHPGCRR